MAASSSLILICCFTNSAPVDKWLHHHHNSNSTSREQNNQQGCCYFSHLSHLSTLPNSHLQNGVVRDQSVTSYCNTVTLFLAVHFTRSTLIRKRIQFITDPMYIIIVELSEFSLCRLRCCALFRLASLHVSTQKHYSSVHSERNAPEIATPHGSTIYSSSVTAVAMMRLRHLDFRIRHLDISRSRDRFFRYSA